MTKPSERIRTDPRKAAIRDRYIPAIEVAAENGNQGEAERQIREWFAQIRLTSADSPLGGTPLAEAASDATDTPLTQRALDLLDRHKVRTLADFSEMVRTGNWPKSFGNECRTEILSRLYLWLVSRPQ